MGNMQMTTQRPGEAGEGLLLEGLLLAGCTSPLWAVTGEGLYSCPGSGLARLGLFSPENKNLFQTKAK